MTRTAVLSILSLAESFEVGLDLAGSGSSASALHESAPVSAAAAGALRTQVGAIARLLNDLGIHRQSSARKDQIAVTESLTALGRAIYTQVFPPTTQQALQALPPASPLVVASNDPALPWELAHDGQDFLAFKLAIGRRLMARQLPRQSPVPQGRRWAPLLIGNPTEDLPHAGHEIELLDRLFDGVSGSARPRVLMARRATKDAVLQALASGSYDLIHYAGHVASDSPAVGLVLANQELLTAAEIESHLTGQPLVFINGCRSAAALAGDPAGSLVYLGRGADGVTSAFIQGGALAVAGSLWPVHDAGSVNLAVAFYRQALQGMTLGEALLEARRASRNRMPHDPLWAAVVLYGDPAQRLAVRQRASGGPATVLAVHLRGLDVLFEQSPETAADLVEQWVANFSTLVMRLGGEIAGLAGDRALATFGVSSARENDAEQGVLAALAVRDSVRPPVVPVPSPLQLGIGLSSGMVFGRQRGEAPPGHALVAGAAVDEACGLASKAADGQILLAESSERLVRRAVVTVPAFLSHASDAAERPSYQLAGLKAMPEASARQLRLVGRGPEIAALDEVWQRCQRGAGQLVSVVGESGVGKSRLLHEFRMTLAGQKLVWLDAACSSAFESASYALFAGILRSALGIDQASATAEAQARLRLAVQGLAGAAWSERAALDSLAVLGDVLAVPFAEISLAHLDLPKREQRLLNVCELLLAQSAAGRPVIVALEDLHWADEASLRLLNRLAAGIGSQPVMILALFRSEDGWRPPWSERSNHRRLHLNALDAEASRSLLGEQLEAEDVPIEIAQAILPRAGGNPFFLRQLVVALEEAGVIVKQADRWSMARPVNPADVPPTVQRVLLSRIQRLAPVVRRVLSIAAVAGDHVQRTVLEAVTSGTADAADLDDGLAQLVDKDFLCRPMGEDVYRFTHALVRATVYTHLLSDQRQGYHRRLGRALVAVYAEREDDVIEMAAQHFYLSVTAAGERGRIVEDADPEDLDAAITALMRSGANAARRFAPHEAIARYEEALQVAGRLGPEHDAKRTVCHEGWGDSASLLGEYELAFSHYQAALAVLPEGAAHAAELSWKIAAVFERQARYDLAADWLECGLAALGGDETHEVFSRICVFYGMICCRQGRLDEGLRWAERSLGRETAQAHNLMAIVLRGQGQLKQARDHCLRSIELAEQSADLVGLAKANTNLGVVLFELGQWQEALRADEQALARQADVGDAYMHALTLCNLSDVHRHLGHLETALDFARQGLKEHQAFGSDFGQALAHLNWGLALLAMDRASEARGEHLEVAYRLMQEHEIQDLRAQVLWSIAECLLHEGRLQEAQAAAEQALSVAAAQESESDQGVVQRVLGSIRTAQGQLAEAEALLAQSLRLLQEHGPTYQLGRTYLALAVLYAATTARHEQAMQALQQARSIFEALEAGLELNKVDALVATL